ncbi:flagellin [uncultured Jannaschia sp.]|uniref:flagellin n=1 Tax=uncultured Jannaschia sp. TaxID=293347 RepID=UPI0026141256|nr:flagellin [uncultured Jannaschia sp.]
MTNNSLLPLLTGRDHSGASRSRIETMTQEMGTGRVADVGQALSSDFSALSQISHALRTTDARAASLGNAAIWLDVMQGSMDRIEQAGTAIRDKLVAALTPTGYLSVDNLSVVAQGAMNDIVSALGRTHDGRGIFTNGDPGGRAPVDVDVLRAETQALAAGATDIASLMTAFDDYFAQGGAFETNALRAFPADPMQFPIGEGKSIGIPVSAGDESVREALKEAALVAALPDLGFPVGGMELAELTTILPARAAAASTKLATSRAVIGTVEERVDHIRKDLDQERTKLETRRSDTISADPYDTATRLQNEMTRLETLYAITARKSRLRLTDYLR